MFEQFSEKCGKLMFLSFDDAQRKLYEREGHPDWLKRNWTGKVYQCSVCHYFHISTVSENDDVIDEEFDKKLRMEKKQRVREEKRISEELKRKSREDYNKAEPVRKMIADMDRRDGLLNDNKPSKENSDSFQNFYSTVDEGSALKDSFGSLKGSKVSQNIDSDMLKKLKNMFS